MKLHDILQTNGFAKAIDTTRAVRNLRQLTSTESFTSDPVTDAKWLVEFSKQWLAMLDQPVEFVEETDMGSYDQAWEGRVH